jgi:outer membrane protein
LAPSQTAIGAAALMFVTLCASASAESLEEAMASAYLDNMELNAARAQLRATDETVPLAVSAFRPTINGAGNASWNWLHSGAGTAFSNLRSVSISVSQPIFEGFRLINGLKQALITNRSLIASGLFHQTIQFVG